MARTTRRRRATHELRWVLSDFVAIEGGRSFHRVPIDAKSQKGRQELARFHSDRRYQGGPNRWFKGLYNTRLDTHNEGELRRCLEDPGYDGVFHPRHRHSARWAWW